MFLNFRFNILIVFLRILILMTHFSEKKLANELLPFNSYLGIIYLQCCITSIFTDYALQTYFLALTVLLLHDCAQLFTNQI